MSSFRVTALLSLGLHVLPTMDIVNYATCGSISLGLPLSNFQIPSLPANCVCVVSRLALRSSIESKNTGQIRAKTITLALMIKFDTELLL